MIELVNENRIGLVTETEVEEAVRSNFKGETTEVGLYLAMARQAQREGYPEIAEALKSIAWDEAWHAARYAELAGEISADLRENLRSMLEGEIKANKAKREVALQAREAGVDEAHDFLDDSSRDEARHAQVLSGILKRYFE